RACDGLTAGNTSITAAYVAHVTAPEQRNQSFGAMGVSSNLVYVVGPALAGVLGSTRLGDRLPVYASLGISLVAAALIAWYLPESRPQGPAAPQQRKASLREALAIPHVGRMLVLY